jgi:hypothetical protein
MRKFKHKTTGFIATETNSGKNFKVNNPQNFTIPSWIIEEGKDWEEIVEKDYEILEIKHKYGAISSYMEKLDSNLENKSIFKIKRLSDGEVFTIGDKIQYGIIENIKTSDYNDGIYIDTKTYLGLPIEKAEKKTCLFITEDGKKIFEGDEFFRVWNVDNRFRLDDYKCYATIKYAAEFMTKTVPHFSTREKAEEYIILNKACLSINDFINILKLPGNEVIKPLKELVKSKL